VAVSPIVASGKITFTGFDVLFSLPTNFSRATVFFQNGFSDEFTAEELQGLYATNHQSEASGLVNGFIVVDGYRSMENPIESITIFAGAGGNCDVVVCDWANI